MPSQPNYQFGTDAISLFRLWYEKWVYTTWPLAGGTTGASSLGVGSTPIINDMRRWNPHDQYTLQAEIEMVQGTQNANTLLTWTADPQNYLNGGNNTGSTAAFRGGVRQMATSIRAVQSLQMAIQNNNPAAVANYQLNYAASLRHLTVAEKLAAQAQGLQGYDLTGLEKEALKQLGLTAPGGTLPTGGALAELINKGSQPFLWRRVQQAIYENRFQEHPWDWRSISVDSSGGTPVQYQGARNGLEGRVLILTGLIAEGGPNLTLNLQRDGQGSSTAGYRITNLAGWAQADDSPWDLWIPAKDNLTFNLSLGPGNSGTTTANLGIRVATLELDEILAVQFGLVTTPSELQNPDTYWRTIVGWV